MAEEIIVEPVVMPAIGGNTLVMHHNVELIPLSCTTVAATVDLVAADLITVRLVAEPKIDTDCAALVQSFTTGRADVL